MRARRHLHDYVPFHFSARSPMMYRISCWNLPEYSDGQRPLVYLVTSIAKERYQPRHVEKAWQRLTREGWLPVPAAAG